MILIDLPKITLLAGQPLVGWLGPLPLDDGAVDDPDVAAEVHLVKRPGPKRVFQSNLPHQCKISNLYINFFHLYMSCTFYSAILT